MDAEEKQFSEDTIIAMDSIVSIVDFFPALEFLRYKSTMTLYRTARNMDNFVKRVLKREKIKENSRLMKFYKFLL